MPKPRTQDLVAIQVRLTPEEHEEFTKAAKADVRSLNMWIRLRLVETFPEAVQRRLRGTTSGPLSGPAKGGARKSRAA